ncbi:MAG: hypothetical protein FWB86_01200 [Treponema sp.]|nr:hypothetical protein [Treponema sp.]MCL2250399.1 hypothetical protein [Treponema sp.]
MKKMFFLFLVIFISNNLYAQLRSFNDIFPNMSDDIHSAVFTNEGYIRSSRKQSGFIILGDAHLSNLDPQIVRIVLNRNPLYLVESIQVYIPSDKNISLLTVYNALSNVRDLKGRLYNSATRNREIPLFEDATRISSERQTNAIPDPPPATVLPQSETVYLRLRDVNFGNTFYRGDMALIQNGLRYTLSNFRNMSYLFVPVIKEEKFIAQLYFEPILEGVLIYSIAGADISDFFASRIHVDSAISKRLAVITQWAIDGIRR